MVFAALSMCSARQLLFQRLQDIGNHYFDVYRLLDSGIRALELYYTVVDNELRLVSQGKRMEGFTADNLPPD
jgi:hypothetical protein